jgi:hypothetical protein
MTYVICPQCSSKVKINAPYDDDTDETVVCETCNWVASKWNFEYGGETEE